MRFWGLVGEGIGLSFSRAPGFAYRSDETGWTVESGEPFVDFNCSLVAPGPRAEDTLARTAESFRARAMPFLVCLVGEARSLASVARKQGLTEGGPLPMMIWSGSQPTAASVGAGVFVREATSPDDFRMVAELAQLCFGLPVDAVARVMPFESPPDPSLRVLLAFQGSELVGAVSHSKHDGGHGIWSLMTRPELRRRGIGGFVMHEAMSTIRAESTNPIFLVSTPDGKPLYDHLGFETIDVGEVWVDRG